jgi:hypothetical protein
LDFWETILQSYSKIETCSCTILMRGTKLGWLQVDKKEEKKSFVHRQDGQTY